MAAGLGQIYPGYLDAQKAETGIRLDKAKATMGETQVAGQQAYGRALSMLSAMGGGPSAPQPPAQQAMASPMTRPMQGGMQGQAGAPMPLVAGPQGDMPPMGQQLPPNVPQPPPQAPQSAPSMGGQQGQLDWRSLSQLVAKSNPGAPPEVIAAAVDNFMPIMNQQAAAEWKQISLGLSQQRIDEAARRGASTDEYREKREERLQQGQEWRKDAAYQNLEVRKQEARRRATEGRDKGALAQWRATIDAQNKQAMNVIRANMYGKPTAEVQAVLAEQEQSYRQEIEDLKNSMKGTNVVASGGENGEPRLTSVVPEKPQNPVTGKDESRIEPLAIPPDAAKQLKEGVITVFGNGQRWTLQNGTPMQLDGLKSK